MATDRYDWQDVKEIERWMADHREAASHGGLDFTGRPDPLEELQYRVDQGVFAGRNLVAVKAFLKSADTNARRVSEEGRTEREERAVAAAETSATAAVQSAEHAGRSAKWAGWAVAVALAALAVAAWPYVKDLFG